MLTWTNFSISSWSSWLTEPEGFGDGATCSWPCVCRGAAGVCEATLTPLGTGGGAGGSASHAEICALRESMEMTKNTFINTTNKKRVFVIWTCRHHFSFQKTLGCKARFSSTHQSLNFCDWSSQCLTGDPAWSAMVPSYAVTTVHILPVWCL